MRTTRLKGQTHVQDDMEKLTHHDGHCSACGKGWHWDDTNGGWLDPELCAKARREEVEYSRRQQDVHENPQ